MSKTSQLPELDLEFTTLQLGEPEKCEHKFIMKGLRTIECQKCTYGITGLTVAEAERIIQQR